MTVDVTFGSEHKQAFALIRQAFLLGTDSLKGIGEYRAAVKILDKMDGISKTMLHKFKNEEGDEQELPVRFESGDEVRDLLEEGGTLTLSHQEFSVLKRCFDSSIEKGIWRVQVAKDVIVAADLLQASAPAEQ